ncbi:MAG TPA: signal peptidase I [Opitutaceae bacterium]|nr:signal peptidase I [Opitutaceae bacterium]
MDFLLDLLLWPFSPRRLKRLFSGERKMRSAAENWLELAEKVRRYRRDRLSAAELEDLAARQAELRRRLREGSDAGALKLAIESLEEVLHRTGGAIYPKSSVAENVDFFLVAAIVILGVRAYFVQPFKIPTNSMWPTYYGMTPENFPPPGPAPSWPARVGRLLAFGAMPKEAVAPRSGEISAQFVVSDDTVLPSMPYTVKPGHKWLVIPTQVLEYTFYVDGQPATVRVPLDFEDFDQVVIQTFFGDKEGFDRHVQAVLRAGALRREYFPRGDGMAYAVVTLPLGRTVRAGEPIVRFDVMTGDQLFVDRFSYHFVPPKVGQGFVFRTDVIPHIHRNDYYIKRLVGVPGDVLQVHPPVLYRNGAPITGAAAFDLNARRAGLYRGYFYGPEPSPPDTLGLLRAGQTLKVPPGHYFAMGDNSLLSSDGRYWGFVPDEAVIGRPLFIYYPFTRRWGPAH